MKYKISQYAKKNNVTTRTVWNWIKRGEVNIERNSTNHIFIVLTDDEINKSTDVAVYARVSSSENKTNLETQKERLLSYCAAKGYHVAKIVTEIGSGVNDKRPKLEGLIMDESIKKIVVEHSDRFARFGVNYIQKLMQMQGRSIEIINTASDETEGLMTDLVSIITSFTARLYGLRRSKRKTEQIIRELETKDA